MKPEEFLTDLFEGLKAPFTSYALVAWLVAIAGASYVLMVLSSYPQYAIQLLGFDIMYIDTAVVALTGNMLATTGFAGLALTVLYSLLAGFALVNSYIQVRAGGGLGVKSLGGIAPGFIAAGCAGCGAGLLGFLGFAGAMAAMPFSGNLVRIGGIAILVYYLGRTGNPRACKV